MSRRWTLSVAYEPPVVVVRGWRGGEVLRNAGLHPFYSKPSGGWICDEERGPNVLAAVESSGAAVVIVGAPVVEDPVSTPAPEQRAAEPEPVLFELGDGA